MPNPDDQRFRPEDAAPEDSPAGDGYPAAPLPAEERGSNPFPDSTLLPQADRPPSDPARPPRDAPPPVPTTYSPELPYGATGTDAAGAIYGAPPAAGPVPPGPPRYGWQPESRRARQSSRLRWAVGVVVVFLLLSLLGRACSAITGGDGAVGEVVEVVLVGSEPGEVLVDALAAPALS